jgi:hypothetical protein
LIAALKQVTEKLWEVEDDMLDCKRSKEFGLKFIELACSVYIVNGEQSRGQRQIHGFKGAFDVYFTCQRSWTVGH